MGPAIVQSQKGVTLLGGGPVSAHGLHLALDLAPVLVAADGGADHALAAGLLPDEVIGDFDSVTDAALARIPPDRLHRIAEQETTDFEKCLQAIHAPFLLALGFTGGRMDHALAGWNALARYPAQRCLLIGPEDFAFLAPLDLALALPEGTRLSLMPMAPVTGTSEGLRWPIKGLEFAPAGRIGTSNITTGTAVRLRFSARSMLVILPPEALGAAIAALVPGWPSP